MNSTEETAESDLTILAEDLRRAVGTFVRAVRSAAGGRSAQAETLGLLERQGAMTVATLAQTRNVRHQTMRLVVAQLESAGLVRREPDPSDRRSHLFSLSAAGRAETIRGRDARAAQIEEMIRETMSSGDRAVLRAGIKLLDRMSGAAEGRAV